MCCRPRLGVVMTVLLLAFVLTITGLPVIAGTTGGFAGTVIDGATHAPIAGAKVTLASSSQTGKTTPIRAGISRSSRWRPIHTRSPLKPRVTRRSRKAA